VRDDTPIFDRARRNAAEHGWDTQVTMAVELVDPEVAEYALKDVLRLENNAHGIGYSFPLRPEEPHPDGQHYKASNGYPPRDIANCAVFPSKIGVPIPEPSGNLTQYIPELKRWAAEDGPKDFRSTERSAR